MKKIALTVLATAFATASLAAPVLAAKASPGKCGTYMFYDMKSKKCKDKR